MSGLEESVEARRAGATLTMALRELVPLSLKGGAGHGAREASMRDYQGMVFAVQALGVVGGPEPGEVGADVAGR